MWHMDNLWQLLSCLTDFLATNCDIATGDWIHIHLLYFCLLTKTHTHICCLGNPVNASLASPLGSGDCPLEDTQDYPNDVIPWHCSFLLSLSVLLTFWSSLASSFMMMMMSASAAAIRPSSLLLCYVSRQIWRWALCLRLPLCLSRCSRFLPLSLPDIKSTAIKLLVNLWWPRQLTAELHQRLKNTESKWGCNGCGVGPWPLIELKDMGEREKRDKYRVTGNRGWRELEGV